MVPEIAMECSCPLSHRYFRQRPQTLGVHESLRLLQFFFTDTSSLASSLPMTSDLSRSALGELLSRQGPLDSAQKIETAVFTPTEIADLLSKLDLSKINRTSIGFVNTRLRPFRTSGEIKGQRILSIKSCLTGEFP